MYSLERGLAPDPARGGHMGGSAPAIDGPQLLDNQSVCDGQRKMGFSGKSRGRPNLELTSPCPPGFPMCDRWEIRSVDSLAFPLRNKLSAEDH